MRQAGWITLVLALVLAWPARSTEADALLGAWEQVATNAGACPTCRIEFRMAGAGLSVVANNGWAASLTASAGDAVGAGRWEDRRRAWVSGKPFTIRFHRDGERLDMTMTVETGTGPGTVIRATFKRAWLGM